MPGYTRQQLQQMAGDAAQKYGVPAGPFAALIQNESNWDPRAVNAKSGAMGLGQFLPSTWASRGGGQDAFDPAVNLDASARYVADLMHRNGGDLQAALMGYTGKNTAEVGRILGGARVSEQAGKLPGWMSAVYSPSDTSTGPSSYPTSMQSAARDSRLAGLQPEVRGAFGAAADDLRGKGIDLLGFLNSGYRSPQEQARLYAGRANNPYPVAPPGTSRHEFGLAVDIGLNRMDPKTRQTVVAALQNQGLYQPSPGRDPIHFELRGTGAPPASQPLPGWMSAVFNPPGGAARTSSGNLPPSVTLPQSGASPPLQGPVTQVTTQIAQNAEKAPDVGASPILQNMMPMIDQILAGTGFSAR